MKKSALLSVLCMILLCSSNVWANNDKGGKEKDIIENVDCKEENNYAKDNYDVYYNGIKVEKAIAGSFQDLGDGYATDKYNAYYKGNIITGARGGNDFKYLGKGYAKDSYTVYYRGKVIKGASASNFQVLGL